MFSFLVNYAFRLCCCSHAAVSPVHQKQTFSCPESKVTTSQIRTLQNVTNCSCKMPERELRRDASHPTSSLRAHQAPMLHIDVFCLHGVVKPCWLAWAPTNKAPSLSLSVPCDAAAHFAWAFHFPLIFPLTGRSKCQTSASFQRERLNLPEITGNSLCCNPKYLLI